MTSRYSNYVLINNACFTNKINLVSVNMQGSPFIDGCMVNAFYNCVNLVYVNDLNIHTSNMANAFYNCSNMITTPDLKYNVTNMYQTFYNCSNIYYPPFVCDNVTNMVNAFYNCSNFIYSPRVSNNVTDLSNTFYGCSGILEAPTIPNSVTNMSGTFCGCANMFASEIPNSVTNMYRTFDGCTNLCETIFIKSENVSNAIDCFNNTSLDKNVYIPFKYANNVNTLTYNSFTGAGYKTDGSVNGVYLKDVQDMYYVDDTKYTITQSGTTIYLNTYTGDSSVVAVPRSKT